MKIDKFNDSHTHISMDVSLKDDIQSFKWIMETSNTERINFLALNAHVFFQETQLDNSKCLFLKSAFSPNGYAGYCMDYTKDVSPEGFLEQIKLAYNAGFDCWKIIESKPNSQKVWGHAVDEPLYDLAFAFAEEKKFPIIVHVADPIQEWDTSYKEGFLKKEEYRQQLFNVLERHPNLVLTFAHFGFMGDKPELVEKLFNKYDSVYLDTVPAPEEFFVISEYHDKWKYIFNTYSEKILFGTDRGNHSVKGYTKQEWLKNFPPINEYITRILRKDGPCDGRFPFPGLEERWGTEFYGLNINDNAYNNIVYNNFIRIYGKPRKINFHLLYEIAKHEFSLPSKSPYKEEDYNLIVNTCRNNE